jgi:hypothetical protein
MPQQDAILYKHVSAIHAGAKLSLLDRKICNALLITSLSEREGSEENQIQVATLLKIIGLKTRNYHQIYLSIRRLASTVIEWGILKKDSFKGDLTGVSFLQMYHIKNGLITYRIAKELKSLLLSPSQYAQIRMNTVAEMTSSFGLALYENCASYHGMGETGWISIEQFKNLMGVGDKYTVYNDLKKRVIKSAIQDVNKHSEFQIGLVEKKENRKTTKIKFIISNKPAVKHNETNPTLQEIGISRSKINQWGSTYEKSYIDEKVNFVNHYPNVQNKSGLLIAAVEKGYKIPVKVKTSLKTDKKETEQLYQVYLNKVIDQWIGTLSDTNWSYFSELLIAGSKNVNYILYKEFSERLPDKSYLKFVNTKRDVYQYIEQILVHHPESLNNLHPPRILNWKEWINESCQPL